MKLSRKILEPIAEAISLRRHPPDRWSVVIDSPTVARFCGEAGDVILVQLKLDERAVFTSTVRDDLKPYVGDCHHASSSVRLDRPPWVIAKQLHDRGVFRLAAEARQHGERLLQAEIEGEVQAFHLVEWVRDVDPRWRPESRAETRERWLDWNDGRKATGRLHIVGGPLELSVRLDNLPPAVFSKLVCALKEAYEPEGEPAAPPADAEDRRAAEPAAD